MGKMLLRLVRRLLALVPAALLLVLLGMLVLPLTEGADTARPVINHLEDAFC